MESSILFDIFPFVKSKRALILFTLMLIGEGVFLLPFVVPRIFRPTFLKAFDITNLELGTAFSLYGIIALVSYFAGGPIADRYSPKKIIIVALLLTALSGIVTGFIPSLATLTLLYGFWGFSTILLFWAAFVKATRQFGGEQSQGQSYGLVDGGRGLIAAVMASGSVLLLDAFLPVDAEVASTAQLSDALSKIIFVFCGLVVLSAVLVWRVFPDGKIDLKSASPKLSLDGVAQVIKKPSIWSQAIILLCAYVGYKCTDDFGLYASDVFGFDDVKAAHLATVSFWVRPIAAIAAGYLGDRYRHSKITIYCFIILIIGSLVIASGITHASSLIIVAMVIASTSLGIYGLRGLYYALFQESKIPLSITGSAIGFISVIGYTPDIFMGPLMGILLDNNPGALGHQYLFAVLAAFGLVGMLASIIFKRLNSNH